MTPQERISYLVYTLEGGNAKVFAEKCKMPAESLSRLRKGHTPPTLYFYTKILSGYPKVRREWLVDGLGEPTTEIQEKGEIMAQIERLTTEVRELSSLMRKWLKTKENG